MKSVVLGASLAAVVASAATADVTYSFTNQTWGGFQFNEAFAAGSLAGTLTGASINVTLDASVSYTYADDLCIYVAGTPLAYGGALQCGGFSNLQAGQRYFWPNGASSTPGTTSIGTVNFGAPISLTGSSLSVWVGNGYGAAGTSGTFTGSITLHGVNAVPAPGAFALLGLAGLAGRRRRA
jgi:MYXO-CTERM domain-containing protein